MPYLAGRTSRQCGAPADCDKPDCNDIASFTLDGPVDMSDECEGGPEANGPEHEEEGIADHEVVELFKVM